MKNWIAYAGIAFIWIISLLVIANGVRGDCYQPQAMKGVCGGCPDLTLATDGNYTDYGSWSPSYPFVNFFDVQNSCSEAGNASDMAWTTIAATTSNTIPSSIRFTFMKPLELRGEGMSYSYLISFDGAATFQNFSIPESCWKAYNDRIEFNGTTLWYNPSPLNGADYYCFNETGEWSEIGFFDYNYYFLTGAAMYWNSTFLPNCISDWECNSFLACDGSLKRCVSVRDAENCGFEFTGNVSSYDVPCNVMANTDSIAFDDFDLRYSGNQILFSIIVLIWLVCLICSFAFSNHLFYILAFCFGILIGLLAMQISWIISISILLFEIWMGIKYLPSFNN